MHLGFSRQRRLLSSAEYSNVFKQPIAAVSRQLTLLGRPNRLDYPRLGLIVAKKQVKRANARNRCKRLLREVFRQQQHQLPAMDFVMIVKKGADTLDNAAFIILINKLWHRFCRQHAIKQSSCVMD
ncbi:MAG: ribonuclease P protein component [Candidatus Symbiodolus clandestinus]